MSKIQRYDLQGMAGRSVVGVDEEELDELEAENERLTAERDELREDLEETIKLLKAVALVVEHDPRESSAVNVKHIKGKLDKKIALLNRVDNKEDV